MPLRLFVNELSFPTEDCLLSDAKARLAALVAVFRAVFAIDRATRIDAAVPLSQLSVGMNWSIAQLRNLPECKDAGLLLQRLHDRSPFAHARAEQEDQVAGGPEYRMPVTAAVKPNETAVGLGFAHSFNGMAVSLATHPAWSATTIELVREAMDADLQISTGNVSARNAADADGIEHHVNHLHSLARPQVASGAEIWARRAELFRNLGFAPRTRRQLEDLQHGDPLVEVVLEMLVKLDGAIEIWRETGSEKPPWPYWVRREPAGREDLTRFEDDQGRMHLFSLHADYAPGENRLHLLLVDRPVRHALIGHIGRKLGI